MNRCSIGFHSSLRFMQKTALAASVAGILASTALAQTNLSAESAQELIRQQERERMVRQRQEQTPNVRLEAAPKEEDGRFPAKEAPCFDIRRMVLQGEDSQHFQWALAAANVASDGTADPATGRCLGTMGINLVMKRMQNALIQRGFVTTRVLAQPQDLKSGTLTLT